MREATQLVSGSQLERVCIASRSEYKSISVALSLDALGTTSLHCLPIRVSPHPSILGLHFDMHYSGDITSLGIHIVRSDDPTLVHCGERMDEDDLLLTNGTYHGGRFPSQAPSAGDAFAKFTALTIE